MYPFYSKYKTNSKTLTGTVINYEIDGNKLTLILKSKEKVIVNYYFKTKKEKQYYEKNIMLGDIYKIEGKFNYPSNNTVPQSFNYKKYLKRQKIFFIVTASKIKKQQNNTSIFYFTKQKIIYRIDKIDNTGYLKTFILGDDSNLDLITKENYQLNGISHLFSISGMHVSLLIGLIMFLLNKVSYNNYYKYTIVITILIFYLFLTGSSPSILRTTIMTIVIIINKLLNLKIKKLDIMLITLIIAIIINPFIIYEVGFQFSYLISSTLNIINKKINNQKNYFIKIIYTSFICFIISFPICIYHFYQVNFLSIILNLVMIPLVSLIIFPLTLIVFIFPIFYNVYTNIITLLENINIIASHINILTITFIKPTLLIIIIYYIIIILVLKNLKYILIFILTIIIHKSYPYLKEDLILTIIDQTTPIMIQKLKV